MMKSIRVLLFILISSLYFSCKCPPSAIELKDISFRFLFIDQEGNNLFFGKDNIYDPYNVKFAIGQEEEFSQSLFGIYETNDTGAYFYLGGFYPRETPYTFYIEFLPDKIDTITIHSYTAGYYEESKGCLHFLYKYDIFFNNIPICTKCSDREIYRIEIK